jgi:hypothetical protein
MNHSVSSRTSPNSLIASLAQTLLVQENSQVLIISYTNLSGIEIVQIKFYSEHAKHYMCIVCSMLKLVVNQQATNAYAIARYSLINTVGPDR